MAGADICPPKSPKPLQTRHGLPFKENVPKTLRKETPDIPKDSEVT